VSQPVDSGIISRRRLDRYELIAEIASGGMGVVLLGRIAGAGGFERLFAIKMMHPHLTEEPQFVAMLLDEARLAAKIHHPNVVATVDVCAAGSSYCLVMDYVNGFQLLDILDHPQIPAQKRIRVVLRALVDVMSGLEAAHNLRGDDGLPLGIVHRDVSPQNVLIGLDGVARLTDFGIALAASRISASRPGMIKGKPGYMAPEQARAGKVDRRADLWALGVMLWEAVAGRRLFVADTEAAIVLKVIEEPIPPLHQVLPGTPPEIDAICSRALQRDPNQRYASAREMAADIEHAAGPLGLIADSHEVSDLIRQTFAAQIDHRRRAIRRHIQAIGPNSGPIAMRDAYDLPNLNDDVISVEGSIPTTGPNATSPLLLQTPRHFDSNPQSLMPRRSTTGGAATDFPPTKKKRSTALFVALFLIAAGGVALGFKLKQLGDSAPPVAPGVQPPAQAEATPTTKEPSPPATPQPSVGVGSPLGSPEPPDSAGKTSSDRRPRPAGGRPTPRPPTPGTAVARPASDPSRPPAGGGRESPTIELNPYQLR
jgi:serine/threonine protein kinase